MRQKCQPINLRTFVFQKRLKVIFLVMILLEGIEDNPACLAIFAGQKGKAGQLLMAGERPEYK